MDSRRPPPTLRYRFNRSTLLPRWGLTIACLWFLTGPLLADPVTRVEVRREAGHYLITVEARIQASRDRVYQVITDYAHLENLHERIRESRLLETGDGHPRVRTVTHGCILFFCRDLVQVLDFNTLEDGTLVGVADPAESDFSFGRMSWKVWEESPGVTILHYWADMKPNFWVPPVIGPWLVKGRFSRVSAEIIESVAEVARGETSSHEPAPEAAWPDPIVPR